VSETIEIPLTRRAVALIDAADYELVRPYKWHLQVTKHGHRYARTAIGTCGVLLMHRLIVAAPTDVMVDHRDGDGLNNRRFNLREASHSQNLMNQRRTRRPAASGITGVYFDKVSAQWWSYIRVDGRSVRLGYFPTKVDAASARRAAELKHYGEFAPVR